jgi:endonuclease YncB( thermonuclease family)
MAMIIQRLFPLLVFSFFGNGCTNQNENGLVQTKEVKEAKAAGRLLTGRVVGISDGDTFKMLLEGNRDIKVRLYGIDAPEKSQDYGTQARKALSDLVFSKEVAVIQKSKDRYGRVVGIAYNGTTNVNEALLKSGMVWHYTDYDKNPNWAALQTEARKQKNGLWSQSNPTPPWLWRKAKRKKAAKWSSVYE